VVDKIAECAGRIQNLLDQRPEVNILRLSEVLEERAVIAYQALGWLARDNRIHYVQKGNHVFISKRDGGAPALPDRESSGPTTRRCGTGRGSRVT
jgi:hypothetical protein